MGAIAIAVLVVAAGAGGVAREVIRHQIAVIPVTIAQAVVVIYALHMLAQASTRFVQRVFSPRPAVRRLQPAEALAAQERVKAERAEQSRRDLIINASYELRTPTASIMGHVESVLLNLVRNAITYTPAGGIVAIALRRADADCDERPMTNS